MNLIRHSSFNFRHSPRHLVIAIAAVLLATLPARAAWLLATADDLTPRSITINTLTAADGLSCSTDDGKLIQVPTRSIVTLTSARSASPSPMPWLLRLRNQDVLYGEPVALKDAALEFKTQELGTVAVPLRLVAGLVTKSAAGQPLSAAADHDTIHLQNGDMLDGVVTALADDKVTIQSDLGETPIDLARINQIVLGGPNPPRTIPALSFRVTLLSGTVLTTPTLTWTVSNVTLKDPAGAEHTCQADQVVSVEVLGGRLVRLAEIDPAQDAHTSYLNTRWPTQTDRNTIGDPLRVAGKDYDHGLGVHTASDLAWDLDGSFDQLRLSVGLDDSAAPYGRADLAVLVDGKSVWQQLNAAPGKLYPVSLTLKNAKHLELRATSPSGLDILGRVDWLDPVIIRP